MSDSWTAMASYFDEHDCEPTDPEQEARTNMLLELARWMAEAGRWGQGAGFWVGAGWRRRVISRSRFWGRRMDDLELVWRPD